MRRRRGATRMRRREEEGNYEEEVKREVLDVLRDRKCYRFCDRSLDETK